jgi:hypothetical protein
VFQLGSVYVGFVVDRVALGQVFSEHFGFPCHSFYRLLHTHHHPSSSGAGTIGQIVVDVPKGLSLTPLKETKKKIKLLGMDNTRLSEISNYFKPEADMDGTTLNLVLGPGRPIPVCTKGKEDIRRRMQRRALHSFRLEQGPVQCPLEYGNGVP